jgi:hypothetical protein
MLFTLEIIPLPHVSYFLSYFMEVGEGWCLLSFQIQSVLFKEDYYPASLFLTERARVWLKKI